MRPAIVYETFVCPWQFERQPIELAFLWWFVNGLDDGFYPHWNLIIGLVSPKEPAEALQARRTPRLQEAIDDVRRSNLEVVYHAKGLALERDCGGLAGRTDSCRPVRMRASRARHFDTIIRLNQWG